MKTTEKWACTTTNKRSIYLFICAKVKKTCHHVSRQSLFFCVYHVIILKHSWSWQMSVGSQLLNSTGADSVWTSTMRTSVPLDIYPVSFPYRRRRRRRRRLCGP